MFDVSLSIESTILILLGLVFVLSLLVACLISCWTEIPGVNEPNTYGGRKKEDKKAQGYRAMLLSGSIHKK